MRVHWASFPHLLSRLPCLWHISIILRAPPTKISGSEICSVDHQVSKELRSLTMLVWLSLACFFRSLPPSKYMPTASQVEYDPTSASCPATLSDIGVCVLSRIFALSDAHGMAWHGSLHVPDVFGVSFPTPW